MPKKKKDEQRAAEPIRALIDEICSEIGPRASGSPEEARTAQLLKERLEGYGVDVRTEELDVAPRALHALLGAFTFGYALCYGLYFLSPVATLAVLASLIGVLAAHRVFDIDVPGLLLPKARSTNVIGRIEASGDRRHTLILAGHIDSAFNMPALRYPRIYPVLAGFVVVLFLAAVALGGLALWRVLLGDVPPFETPLLLFSGVAAIGAVALGACMIRSDAVPGANDNLSAIAVAWAAARRLAEQPPEHTEVWIVGFGSEEAGLKGSREFVSRYDDALDDALLINLESLGQAGKLHVLTGEMLAFSRHSERAVSLVEEAAVDAQVYIARKFLKPGLTDAASFSRKGLHATTLIRFTEAGYLDAYHTHDDNPSLISEESLREGLRVCMRAVEILDEQ